MRAFIKEPSLLYSLMFKRPFSLSFSQAATLGFIGVTLILWVLSEMRPSKELTAPEVVSKRALVEGLSQRGNHHTLRLKLMDPQGPLNGLEVSVSDYQRRPLRIGSAYDFDLKLLPLGPQPLNYYTQNAFFARGYVKSVAGQGNPEDALLSFRTALTHWILSHSTLPWEQRALLPALLWGDGSLISMKSWALFSSSGLIHLLVVSGMHISFMFIFARTLFSILLSSGVFLAPRGSKAFSFFQLGVIRKVSVGFALVFSLVYALISGFEGSTARALLMLLPLGLSAMLDQRLRLGVSLVFSLLGLLWLDIFSPAHEMQSFGLWLSYGAIVAIYLADLHHHRPQKEVSGALSHLLSEATLLLRLQLYLFFLLSPLLLFHAGKLSLLSPLLNLVLVPLFELLLMPVLFVLVLVLAPFQAGVPLVDLLSKGPFSLLFALAKLGASRAFLLEVSPLSLGVALGLVGLTGVAILLPRARSVALLAFCLPFIPKPPLGLRTSEARFTLADPKTQGVFIQTARHAFSFGSKHSGGQPLSCGNEPLDLEYEGVRFHLEKFSARDCYLEVQTLGGAALFLSPLSTQKAQRRFLLEQSRLKPFLAEVFHASLRPPHRTHPPSKE